MKRIPVITCIITLLFSFEINSMAQKVWTLEECIGYALTNNLQIKRQYLQAEMANNNLTQSYVDLLPDLSAGGSHNLGEGRVADYSNFSYSKSVSSGSFGLRSNIVIFSGFQKLNTIKMQKYAFLTTKENLEKAKNDIALTIASAYLQILFDKEYREITQSQLELSKLQVEKTSKLYEVGNVAKGSLLEIKAQAAAEEATVIDAQNRLELSKLTLAQILDLDTVKGFSIYSPEALLLPDTITTTPESIYLHAVGVMPQIKSAEYTLERAKADLAIARGGRLPQISLSYDYYTQYNLNAKQVRFVKNGIKIDTVISNYPVMNQLNDNLYKQLSLNLSIPIFTRFQTQTRISNAKISRLDSEFALRQSQIGLRKEIEQAFLDAKAAYKNYLSRTEASTASEESFKYVQQKFDVGMVNSVDYSVAKNSLMKAKSDLLQSKYQYVFKSKVLDFYSGKQIKL